MSRIRRVLIALAVVLGVALAFGLAACDKKETPVSGGSGGIGSGGDPADHKEHNYVLIDEVKPTCTEYGSRSYQCTECGASYQDEVEALGHSWGSWSELREATCYQTGLSKRTCTVCGFGQVNETVGPAHHLVEKAGTRQDPTCEREGSVEWECDNEGCDHEETEILARTPHTKPETGGGVSTESTCLEWGYTTYECEVCGQSFRGDPVAPKGHDWQPLDEDPDCETWKWGRVGRKCSRCDLVEAEFSAPRHTFEGGVCTVCGQGADEAYLVVSDTQYIEIAENKYKVHQPSGNAYENMEIHPIYVPLAYLEALVEKNIHNITFCFSVDHDAAFTVDGQTKVLFSNGGRVINLGAGGEVTISVDFADENGVIDETILTDDWLVIGLGYVYLDSLASGQHMPRGTGTFYTIRVLYRAGSVLSANGLSSADIRVQKIESAAESNWQVTLDNANADISYALAPEYFDEYEVGNEMILTVASGNAHNPWIMMNHSHVSSITIEVTEEIKAQGYSFSICYFDNAGPGAAESVVNFTLTAEKHAYRETDGLGTYENGVTIAGEAENWTATMPNDAHNRSYLLSAEYFAEKGYAAGDKIEIAVTGPAEGDEGMQWLQINSGGRNFRTGSILVDVTAEMLASGYEFHICYQDQTVPINAGKSITLTINAKRHEFKSVDGFGTFEDVTVAGESENWTITKKNTSSEQSYSLTADYFAENGYAEGDLLKITVTGPAESDAGTQWLQINGGGRNFKTGSIEVDVTAEMLASGYTFRVIYQDQTGEAPYDVSKSVTLTINAERLAQTETEGLLTHGETQVTFESDLWTIDDPVANSYREYRVSPELLAERGYQAGDVLRFYFAFPQQTYHVIDLAGERKTAVNTANSAHELTLTADHLENGIPLACAANAGGSVTRWTLAFYKKEVGGLSVTQNYGNVRNVVSAGENSWTLTFTNANQNDGFSLSAEFFAQFEVNDVITLTASGDANNPWVKFNSNQNPPLSVTVTAEMKESGYTFQFVYFDNAGDGAKPVVTFTLTATKNE